MIVVPRWRSLVLLLSGAGTATALSAQHAHDTADSTRSWRAGAMAIGVWSRARPGPLNTTVSEGYLTQPMAMGRWQSSTGRLVGYVTLNAEGATLARGEINPGVYGEGYVDRRHPHTWLHEVMIGTRSTAGAVRWSLFGGKGFVPYGTDDPMVRPFVKYPVNHHHAQLLERLVVTASGGWRDLTLEVATFNGDEPESPTDLPNADRLFDSWASRGTWRPRGWVEGSASIARVKSPEFAAGFGLDQRKEAVSLRLMSAAADRMLLVEAARTREFSSGRQAFDFSTWLAEGTLPLTAVVALSARLERTIRPEEERLESFYRTPRPLHDFSIIGRTRWTNATVALTHAGWGRGVVRGRPFVEVGYHRPRATLRPVALDPVELYGAGSIWMVSAGVRMHVGDMRPRFGRYADAH